MKHLTALLLAMLTAHAFPFSQPGANTLDLAKNPPAVRFDPVLRDIEGWKVHVEPALVDGEQREEGRKALTMLANHLQRIKILVPAGPLAKLQTIELWMEHDHSRLKSMQYHKQRRLISTGTISIPSSAPS